MNCNQDDSGANCCSFHHKQNYSCMCTTKCLAKTSTKPVNIGQVLRKYTALEEKSKWVSLLVNAAFAGNCSYLYDYKIRDKQRIHTLCSAIRRFQPKAAEKELQSPWIPTQQVPPATLWICHEWILWTSLHICNLVQLIINHIHRSYCNIPGTASQ